jgi:hypothetical protein
VLPLLEERLEIARALLVGGYRCDCLPLRLEHLIDLLASLAHKPLEECSHWMTSSLHSPMSLLKNAAVG